MADLSRRAFLQFAGSIAKVAAVVLVVTQIAPKMVPLRVEEQHSVYFKAAKRM